MQDFIQYGAAHGLFPRSRVGIRDSAAKPIHREVVCFSFSEPITPILHEELLLKNGDGSYSERYQQLISGFLLGF
jgi:tRNA1(Val) A37 N6-methylase TrmN6